MWAVQINQANVLGLSTMALERVLLFRNDSPLLVPVLWRHDFKEKYVETGWSFMRCIFKVLEPFFQKPSAPPLSLDKIMKTLRQTYFVCASQGSGADFSA